MANTPIPMNQTLAKRWEEIQQRIDSTTSEIRKKLEDMIATFDEESSYEEKIRTLEMILDDEEKVLEKKGRKRRMRGGDGMWREGLRKLRKYDGKEPFQEWV